MLWMREPFLSHCDEVDCGRFIVHGHTPQRTDTPDLRKRRLNLDTAAVIGGPLTAAVFDDTQAGAAGVSHRARGRMAGLAAVRWAFRTLVDQLCPRALLQRMCREGEQTVGVRELGPGSRSRPSQSISGS